MTTPPRKGGVFLGIRNLMCFGIALTFALYLSSMWDSGHESLSFRPPQVWILRLPLSPLQPRMASNLQQQFECTTRLKKCAFNLYLRRVRSH